MNEVFIDLINDLMVHGSWPRKNAQALSQDIEDMRLKNWPALSHSAHRTKSRGHYIYQKLENGCKKNIAAVILCEEVA